MRVLHVPFTYFPDPVGGTEVYVAQLAAALASEGISSAVCAPGARAARYEHAGVPVERFPLAAPADIAELYGASPAPGAADDAERMIAGTGPDVVHLHAYTRGVPLEFGDAARRLGLPVVITYHTPSVTCQRGTLMLYGARACDGALFVDRCAACVLRLHGMPGLAAEVVARTPKTIGTVVGRLAPRAGGPAAALRMTALMHRRHIRADRHLRSASAIVAVSSWVADVLAQVGVPPHLVTVVPHGIAATRAAPRAKPTGPVRLAFLGRLHPTKGIDLVLEALRRLPSAALELHLYAMREDGEGAAYAHEMLSRAARDPRVRLHDALSPTEVVDRLSEFDGLVVPSRWRETGPLVVLEAFAAGVPVIAAAIGAIPERVRDGVDGLLFAPDDAAALAAVIDRFVADGALRDRLTGNVVPPRTMTAVARDMAAIYARVTGVREPALDRTAAG